MALLLFMSFDIIEYNKSHLGPFIVVIFELHFPDYTSGFLWSLKTWKSHGNSKCKFQALEKLWKTIFFPKF